MGHEFTQEDRLEVEATPEQVWQGIATGPGIDSWFMGRNEVDQANGVVRQSFGGYEPEHRITAWEPERRLAYRSDAPDGRFIAYEFLIEGREQASTVLRMVTSGFLPGDDWADEYEAMRAGGQIFFATLSTYLAHFAGRTALPLTAAGPAVQDWPATWRRLGQAFGLAGAPAAGDRVSFEPDGLPPVDGEVFFVNGQTVGVRTDDALYRFLAGFHGPLIACHCLFTPGLTEADRDATEQAWQSWLTKTLS
ncbi:SRPBCC family protein [Actinophytocola xanthii]|uniref:SRPBCC domain-containing protein n=1 Tax=Actinophytocola xanthii TaxID=1912961 RepID=A0A1Q8CTY3_9PSEU|nr:SRPBCC domain-containing protein [Actinophytocola xanthii]OLF17818.1 hypothetical protein BU204_10090 [Actinophytocola xanthii]